VGVLGLGQTADPADVNNAFTRLNWMLAQWQRKRWLVYHLINSTVTSTGAMSYTVGPGGAFNLAARPDKLEAAFLTQIAPGGPGAGNLNIDYPLKLIHSREQYNDIALKGLVSFPSYIFYDNAYPMGSVYPYPIPNPTIYSVTLSVKEILGPFTNTTALYTIPPEYYAAMQHNLAVRLFESYGVQAQMKPITMALAKEALNVLRMGNAQVPNLRMPDDLIRPGIYNPYSDQIR